MGRLRQIRLALSEAQRLTRGLKQQVIQAEKELQASYATAMGQASAMTLLTDVIAPEARWKQRRAEDVRLAGASLVCFRQ